MTNSRHPAAPIRGRRARSKADKLIAAGLATATCIGIVGVIGVRSIEASAAEASTSSPDVATLDATPVSSTGLTEAQLDAYASQLSAESAKLDAYRAKLVKAANRLQAASTTQVTSTQAKPVAKAAPKPVAKPVAKAAPKPVAKPTPAAKKAQSHTKSS